jgi:GNAT superfamily N-acetyltransferase
MVTIRREHPDDAEAVAALHVRAWQAGYAGIMPDEVLARLNPAAWAQRRRQWRTADDDSVFTTYVAEDDDRIVGFATVGPYRQGQDHEDLDPTYGEILAMYVEPVRWRGGVGTALMATARATLAAAEHDVARLWVLEQNARARRFYEREGFAPDGERSTYTVELSGGRDPVALDELRYAARLGAG